MNCELFEKDIDDYINGTLSTPKRRMLEEHAAGCGHCRKKLDEAVALDGRLKNEFAAREPKGRHSFQSFSMRWGTAGTSAGNTTQPLEGTRMRRIIIILAVLLFVALAAATVFAHEYYNLLDRLGDKDPDVRSTAAVELSENVWNTQVYDILLAAMDSESPDVRAAAVESLGMIVKKAKGLSTKILKMVSDVDSRVQWQALTTLRDTGLPAEAMPVLMEKLVDGDADMIIYTIVDEAKRQSGWTEQLTKMLIDDAESGSERKRSQAVGVLGDLYPQPGVYDALYKALWDESLVVRTRAISAISHLGDSGKDAIPRMIEMLEEDPSTLPHEDSDNSMRTIGDPYTSYIQFIMNALGWFGQDAKDAVPVLVDIYRQGDIYPVNQPPSYVPQRPNDIVMTVRMSALQALGKIGVVNSDVIETLTDAFYDKDRSIRIVATWAMEDLGQGALPLLPELLVAIDDENESIRNHAANAIKALGPAASDAAPKLIDILLNSEDSKVRTNVMRPLKAMSSVPGVLPALIKVTEDANESLRKAAISALGEIGLDDDSAASAVLERLNDESSDVQVVAAAVLVKSEKYFNEGFNVLLNSLEWDEPDFYSVRVLGSIGPDAEAALSRLKEMLDSGKYDDYNRIYLLCSIAKISGDVDEPLSMLIDMLDDEDQNVARSAAHYIGELGPAAKNAVSALVVKLSTGDAPMRISCVTALEDIGPDAAAALPILRALAAGAGGVALRDAAIEAIEKIEGEDSYSK